MKIIRLGPKWQRVRNPRVKMEEFGSTQEELTSNVKYGKEKKC